MSMLHMEIKGECRKVGVERERKKGKKDVSGGRGANDALVGAGSHLNLQFCHGNES